MPRFIACWRRRRSERRAKRNILSLLDYHAGSDRRWAGTQNHCSRERERYVDQPWRQGLRRDCRNFCKSRIPVWCPRYRRKAICTSKSPKTVRRGCERRYSNRRGDDFTGRHGAVPHSRTSECSSTNSREGQERLALVETTASTGPQQLFRRPSGRKSRKRQMAYGGTNRAINRTDVSVEPCEGRSCEAKRTAHGRDSLQTNATAKS